MTITKNGMKLKEDSKGGEETIGKERWGEEGRGGIEQNRVDRIGLDWIG